MGTSLSGLTPATTFDGLLKTSDNEPLDGTLKAISTGDGTDTMLELSTSALQIGGATGMYWDNTNKRLGFNDVTPTSRIDIKNTFGASSLSQLDRMGLFVGYTSASFGIALGGTSSYTSGLIQGTNNIGNASGTLSLNPFGGNVGVGSVSPSAQLHIKGSGASAGTTSLLVQNGEGTDMLKVTDNGAIDFGVLGLDFSNDGSGGTMSVASDRYIKLASSLSTYSALSAHLFKTFDGSAYSEAMRITGNTDQFVGIGETNPTAKLQIKGDGTGTANYSFKVQNAIGNNNMQIRDDGAVFLTNQRYTFNAAGGAVLKGSGATSATTALLVQNSAGTEHLKVTDDGEVNVRQSLYVNHSSVSSRALRLGWGSMYATDNSSELNIGAVYSQNSAPRIHLGGKTRASGADAIQVQTLNGMYIATTAFNEDPSAQLHIKGSGATSATTALLVQNSAGTELLKVRDDGWVDLPSTLNGGAIRANVLQVDSVNFKVDGTNNYFQSQFSKNIFGADNTNADASAVLQADSTTQGFLPPRMTTTERDAISTPAAGLMVYNTTTNKAQCYNGTAWQDLF